MAQRPQADPEAGRQVHPAGLPLPGVHGLGQVQVRHFHITVSVCVSRNFNKYTTGGHPTPSRPTASLIRNSYSVFGLRSVIFPSRIHKETPQQTKSQITIRFVRIG